MSNCGDVAQLGERCVRNAQVGGSSPLISTICFLSCGDLQLAEAM